MSATTHFKNSIRVAFALMFASASASLFAQAASTASQRAQLSVFGGVTGTSTAFNKNLGVTAGVDLGFRRYFGLHPSLELRGTYPIDSGSIAGFRNVVGGIKLGKDYGRLHPYGDILIGRGQINYNGAGFPSLDGTSLYVQSISTVVSPGIGADFTLTDQFSLKADAQFQHYSVPVVPSGTLWAKPLTLGVVYRLDFNRHLRHRR